MEADDVAELARLLSREIDTLSDDELLSLITTWGALRRTAPEGIGRAVAALYQRKRLSWPEIGRLTGIPPMTAHDWARPYLSREDDPA
ncbi:hypothetical protein GCM10009609_55920 [Pseudonocardia aurantiaca]|uniref:Uncharacterized protein n=1 Tax=Pseudonocardia aurantiaca TaxID=75290 RepID=A0ABW4FXT0_9PSEU